MNLVIFDVDGTLTHTNDIDNVRFQQAFREEFGMENISCDWKRYRYTTDRGIATEILKSELGREPLPEEQGDA